MVQQIKKRKVARIVLWIVAIGLFIASGVIFFSNYKALEKTVDYSEKTVVEKDKVFQYYFYEYKTTKTALDEANVQLTSLREELSQANNDLGVARTELSSVQTTNDELRAMIAELEAFKAKAINEKASLEELIASLKDTNQELDAQLQSTRKELAAFSPEIENSDEGRLKLKLFKQHVRLVKKNMGLLRYEARKAKAAAQKERDRLDSLYGNSGYLIKDGKDQSVTRFDDKNVDIDVKFINK